MRISICRGDADVFTLSGKDVRAYYATSQGRELTYEIIEKGRIFGESSFHNVQARLRGSSYTG